jgi:gas vesicle protein
MNNFDPELHGDDRDDYTAHQEAELAEAQGESVELVDDDELRSLLAELWQEEADRMMEIERQQEEYSEEDAFRDFYTDYANEMEG